MDDTSKSPPRCAAPFSQLLLKPDGRATPCCYLYGHHLGNVAASSWQHAWNSNKLRKLRREFLTGRPRTCRGRMRHIGCHKEHSHLEHEIVWQEVQDQPPRRLDVRLNGQCNLSCRMCEVWQEPNRSYESSNFWTLGPSELFPFLREVDVLGGEPFIQRDTFRLIGAVNQVNPDCQWGFVTNGHYPWSQRLQSCLKAINIRFIQLSLDAICPHTYARQRQGDFRLPMQTLQKLLDLRHTSAFELRVSLCATALNWADIPGFLRFVDNMELTPEIQLAYHSPDPTILLRSLTEKQRHHVIHELRRHTPRALQHWLTPVVGPLE